MAITPRQLGALALLALAPLVVTWVATGSLTLLNVVFGAVNVVLIAVTVMLAFSPAESAADDHSGEASH